MTNRNPRRAFEFSIWITTKLQRATMTTVTKGGQGARTYGEQNLGIPRVLMCTCLHSKNLEPIHVVLGFRLLVCEAHSLFWLISASINGSTPSISLHALRLQLWSILKSCILRGVNGNPHQQWVWWSGVLKEWKWECTALSVGYAS